MKPVAELLIVVYNDRKNAYAGPRNQSVLITINEEINIKSAIENAFNTQLAKVCGCVLVKFVGKMYLCERDTVNPKNIYTRHEINFHPLQYHFTI